MDAHRLIRNIHLTPEGIVLDENGVSAAESLLIARTLMRPSVYYHHVSRIGECMFQLAVLAHMATCPPVTLSISVHSMTGNACTNSKIPKALLHGKWPVGLTKDGSTKEPSTPGRIRLMQQHSRPVWPVERAREVAGEIAGRAGCQPSDVLVDIPPIPGEMSLEVQVKNRHAVVGFAELSPSLQTLNQTRREQWRLGIYTLPGTAMPWPMPQQRSCT